MRAAIVPNFHRFLMFAVEHRQFALELDAVERVTSAVEVTPVPGSHPLALGAINVQGRVVCVLDFRRVLGFPSRELEIEDQFVIARTADRLVALPVDTSEVVECSRTAAVEASDVLPWVDGVKQIVKRDGTLVLLCDLDRLIALAERTSGAACAAEEAVPDGGGA
jgi:purine-binding chemotaxis protein CheW